MTTGQIEALEEVINYMEPDEKKDYEVWINQRGVKGKHVCEYILILKQMLEQVKKKQK